MFVHISKLVFFLFFIIFGPKEIESYLRSEFN